MERRPCYLAGSFEIGEDANGGCGLPIAPSRRVPSEDNDGRGKDEQLHMVHG
jgi:hypothetical protein